MHNLVWDGTTAAPSATVTDTRQYVKDQLNMLRQVRRTEKERETERQTEKERETERETEKERETETETERDDRCICNWPILIAGVETVCVCVIE